MKVGAFVYATDRGAPPDAVASAAESMGLESIFFCEHSHIPAPPQPLVDPDGNELPEYYGRLYDPLVALGAAASVTKRLRLGTAVCVLSQRDPIITAKEVATLDRLSNGRVEFGVGAGWSDFELESHGRAPADRFRLFEDHIQVVHTLWTTGHFELERGGQPHQIAQWPRPVQTPHPPILIAGNGRAALRRAARLGDGWLATHRHPDLGGGMRELQILRQQTGRQLSATLVAGFVGKGELARFKDLGIDRVLLPVTPGSSEQVLDRLHALAEFQAMLDR